LNLIIPFFNLAGYKFVGDGLKPSPTLIN